jgi:ferredoxin
VKVAVDEDLCVGTASCVDDCPAVFKLIDGKSHVKVDSVPSGEEDNVRLAIDDCPMGAISIVEE